jgi:hypothetical protein
MEDFRHLRQNKYDPEPLEKPSSKAHDEKSSDGEACWEMAQMRQVLYLESHSQYRAFNFRRSRSVRTCLNYLHEHVHLA